MICANSFDVVDPLLVQAIVSGTTANHSLSDIRAECSTSNCEWSSYHSLGFCSSAIDLSSNLIKTGANQTLNISLPIQGLYDGRNDTAGSQQYWMGTMPGISLSLEPLPGLLGALNTLAEIYIIYFSPCEPNGTSTSKGLDWPNYLNEMSNWRAVKGTISLCVQNLSTSIMNGTTNTVELPRIDNDTSWLLFNSTPSNFLSLQYPLTDTVTVVNRTNFSMDLIPLISLVAEFQKIFNGSETLTRGGDYHWNNEVTLSIARDIFGPDPNQCIPGAAPGIDGFQRRLQNIAASLTNTYDSLSKIL